MSARLTFLAAGLMLSTPALALPTFVSELPNGSTYGCDTCHTNGGGTPRNDFGLAWEATPTWADVATLDSDGDGCSNGGELGDPDGTWMPGDDPPSEAVSHPGDADDVDCEEPGDTDPPDPDVEPEKGCATVSAAPAIAVLLGGMALFRRRRR